MELIKDKVMQTHNGVLLLDGYPRNMSNYRVGKASFYSVDVVRDHGGQLQCAGLFAVQVQLRVFGEAFDCARKGLVVFDPSLHRRGRSDDNLEVIKRRFYSYEHETKEVLDTLREKVWVLGDDSRSIRLRRFARSLRLKKRRSVW